MVIKGTIDRISNNRMIIYKRPYTYVLVTSEDLSSDLCVGDRVKIRGEWHEKHYVKHDFSVGKIMAFNASTVQIV